MDSPVPGVYHITNNQTGFYLDVANFLPRGNIITWSLNNPPTGNQQWNVAYLDPTKGSDDGYILTALKPNSHIWASDNAAAQLKADPSIQKAFYIYPANKRSMQYIIATENRDCNCDGGFAWEGHSKGFTVTLEKSNSSHAAQYWNLARLS